ncbi:MAG: 4Fe-4S binding protein, partial [Firmicutes bacterium]|nr:4Fe-4S binding protein [Bacillota bacterium]
YMGVKGGLVVLVADDPGPISSQTEQDTRTFAAFSKVPVFDPSGTQEAYEMIQEAFAFSEKYQTPVLLRPTTRVSHGYASIQVKDPEEYQTHIPEGFVKDSSRWVIFPRLSNINHRKIEERNASLSHILSAYERNRIYPADQRFQEKTDGIRRGIASGGFSFTYAMEALQSLAAKSCDNQLLDGKVGEKGLPAPLFKVSTPFPFPEDAAVTFLSGLDEVLCVEELDPVIERELVYVCGKHHLNTKIYGKLSGHMPLSGENSLQDVKERIAAFLKIELPVKEPVQLPKLPVRPPVLCAGCPHRASFFAVKQAMQGKKTIFCGDIGCYTLGNAMPLDMVDTCLCMGAGLGIAQAISHLDKETACFAFVGDSTFFASAIPGVVNAVYNQAEMTLVVLDNSTTAMTGHQPHPGTGRTMMGDVVAAVDTEQVLRGIGLRYVKTVNPLEHQLAVETVKEAVKEPGVKAIIFKSPCIAITKPQGKMQVSSAACIGCKKCIRSLGCPALVFENGKAAIDASQCTGCGLCAQICPTGAILDPGKGGRQDD